MHSQNKRLFSILLAIAILLLLPLIAMQLTDNVSWSQFDFIVAGTLLLGASLLCEFVLRTVKKKENRVIVCSIVLFFFFLLWAELAVGIFGTPFAGN